MTHALHSRVQCALEGVWPSAKMQWWLFCVGHVYHTSHSKFGGLEFVALACPFPFPKHSAHMWGVVVSGVGLVVISSLVRSPQST